MDKYDNDGNVIHCGVECKNFQQGTVGRPIIQKFHSAMAMNVLEGGMKYGYVVTSGTFTNEAVEYAKEINRRDPWLQIILLDKHYLEKYERGKKKPVVEQKADYTTEPLPGIIFFPLLIVIGLIVLAAFVMFIGILSAKGVIHIPDAALPLIPLILSVTIYLAGAIIIITMLISVFILIAAFISPSVAVILFVLLIILSIRSILYL
jgi:hypothetical protein